MAQSRANMLKLEALGYISNYHNTAESLTKLSEIELHCGQCRQQYLQYFMEVESME